jgi:SulP family sulfate permease
MQSLNGARIVVFDFDRVPYIDQTGIYALEEIIRDLKNKGIEVMFVNVQAEPLKTRKRMHLVPNVVPENNFFSNMNQCMKHLQEVFAV